MMRPVPPRLRAKPPGKRLATESIRSLVPRKWPPNCCTSRSPTPNELSVAVPSKPSMAPAEIFAGALTTSVAIFHFVDDAKWKFAGAGAYDLEWVMQSNGHDIILPTGKKMSYGYQLQVNGYNPLVPSGLSGLHCVANVAR